MTYNKRCENMDDNAHDVLWNALRTLGGRLELRKRVHDNAIAFRVRDAVCQSTCGKTMKQLLQHPTMTTEYIRHAQPLGKGAYSVAHVLRSADEHDWPIAVGLLKAYEGTFLGSMASPYFGVNACTIIAQLLWECLAETRYTPHLIAPWFNCMGYGVSRVHRDRGTHSIMQFSERAKHGTVHGYCKRVLLARRGERPQWMDGLFGKGQRPDRLYIEQWVRVIIFQVTYTLCAIYRVFPRFRHNDLRDVNVLLQVGGRHGTSTRYQAHRDYVWDVPNMNVCALISDYDVSTIPGTLDNYLTLESEFSMPLLHCTTHQDHATDLFVFVSCLVHMIRGHVSEAFINTLQHVWKNSLGRYDDNVHYMRPPNIQHIYALPSAFDVLFHSNLFENFKSYVNAPHKQLREWFTMPQKHAVPPSRHMFKHIVMPTGPYKTTPHTQYVPILYARTVVHYHHDVHRVAIPQVLRHGIPPSHDIIRRHLHQLWRAQRWGPPHIHPNDVVSVGQMVVDACIERVRTFLQSDECRCRDDAMWWPPIYIMAYRDVLTRYNLRRKEGCHGDCSWVMQHYVPWWYTLQHCRHGPTDETSPQCTSTRYWRQMDPDTTALYSVCLLQVAQQWSWWRTQ